MEDILKSRKVFGPLTMLQVLTPGSFMKPVSSAHSLPRFQCCPTSDGAAAAVLCSEDFVKKYNLQSQVGLSSNRDEVTFALAK